jgi:hypothetical protein
VGGRFRKVGGGVLRAMLVYTAEPGSKSEQALNLLASWTATPEEETTHADHEERSRHGSGA